MNICNTLAEQDENRKRKIDDQNENKENNENDFVVVRPKKSKLNVQIPTSSSSATNPLNESHTSRHNIPLDKNVEIIDLRNEESDESEDSYGDESNEDSEHDTDEESDEENDEDFTHKSKSLSVKKVKTSSCKSNSGEIIDDSIRTLHSILKSAKASGTDSIGGEATELPVYPDLFVKNYGDVPLPLNEQVAESLIKIASQAPFGYKYDTLMDKSIRDTYQIEPSEIQINNPEWNKGLNILVKRVAKGLGIHSEIKAKLYKMLIYKTGSHFKKHKDTEKEKDMFGTLILQLPSKHEGGELLIYQKNKKLAKYDFGKKQNKSAYQTNFVAHYADVEHEVLEVKKGYRLALVYSLCWPNGNSYVNHNRDLSSQMNQCLSILSESKDSQIGVLLDHLYTDSSFTKNGFKALKGLDNDRFNLLKNVNDSLPPEKQMSFYIADANLIIESYFTGYDEDMYAESYSEDDYDGKTEADWEENDRNTIIDKWYDISGRAHNWASTKVNFFKTIIDPNQKPGESGDLDDERTWGKHRHVSIEGWTGNEGCNRTTEYHKYILTMWPKKYEFETFLKLDKKLCIGKLLISDMNNPVNLNHLESLVKQLIDNEASNRYSYFDNHVDCETMSKIFELIIKTNNLRLCKMLLNKFSYMITMNQTFKLIMAFGWNELENSLKSALLPIETEKLSSRCDLIELLLNAKKADVAYQILSYCVLPILDDINELVNKYKDQNRSENHYFYGYASSMAKQQQAKKENITKQVNVYARLINTILLFQNNNHSISEHINKFVNSMKLIEPDSLKELLKLFLDNMSHYSSIKELKQLFELRENWLNEKLKGTLEFSWSMPASVPNHPRFENFLKSQETNMTYMGVFNGIHEARHFADIHKGLKDNYSLLINTSGTGKKATCTIAKTKDYYESCVTKNKQYQYELSRVKKAKTQFKS